jgi:probable rRNA maturation factor
MATELAIGEESELSVVLVDDDEMRRLNAQYRGTDEVTDVLSFPQTTDGELEDGADGGFTVLGDIAIGVQVAARQASQRGHSTEEEIDLLAAHGLLHLLGYNHENTLEAERMEGVERKLVGSSILGEETGD